MKKLLSIVLATGIAGASTITPFTNADVASISKAESLADQPATGGNTETRKSLVATDLI